MGTDKDDEDNTIDNWVKWQYPNQINKTQSDKVTSRQNKKQIYNTESSSVMRQERLGITNTIPLEVAQDYLNPTLRQVITRYITIDSQYRNNLYPYTFDPNSPKGSDTNFTCNLSEEIKNVIGIKLSSLHIPATSYTFDPYIGNTCFWIQYSDLSNSTYNSDDSSACKVCITEGNYATTQDLINELNYDIADCCPDLSGLRVYIPTTNIQNQIIQFLNLSSYYIKLTFWPMDKINCLDCGLSNCTNLNAPPPQCSQSPTYTQNLGYYLGYRILHDNVTDLTVELPPVDASYLPISFDASDISEFNSYITTFWNDLSKNPQDLSGANTAGLEIIWWLQTATTPPYYPNNYYKNTPSGIWFIGSAVTSVDLAGGEYLLFTLDDYNKNYIINGTIGIGQQNTKLDIPSYAINLGEDASSNICADPSTNTTQFVPTFSS